MHGRLEWAELDSSALADNPLGDPSRRRVLLYLPARASGTTRVPSIYFLHGFTGSVDSWTNVSPFQPTVPERLDALVASGTIPPVIGVFVDGWTRLGGSQWIDSAAIGRYATYLTRDVVSFVDGGYPTIPDRAARAVVGKSSGGYGALVMGGYHADTFGHIGSHAGDSAFEYCYLPDFPKAAAALQGTDPARWFEEMVRRAAERKLRGGDHEALNILAMAAAYSPRPGAPLGLELPFEPETGRIREEVWVRWLSHDPVRFVPERLASFRTLRSIYLDCGTQDEFQLRWGARMLVESMRRAGLDVTYEEFDDGHRGIDYRYVRSLSFLGPRLAS